MRQVRTEMPRKGKGKRNKQTVIILKYKGSATKRQCERESEREEARAGDRVCLHWGKSYCHCRCCCVLVCTVIFAITVKTKDKHLDSFNVIREEKREKKCALRRETYALFSLSFARSTLFPKRQSLAHNEVDTLLACSSTASSMQIQLNTLHFEMTRK